MIRQAYVAGAYTADTRTRTLQHIMRALVAGCALTKQGLHVIVPHAMGSHRATWDGAMTRCREIIQSLDPAQDCLVLLLAEALGVEVEHV